MQSITLATSPPVDLVLVGLIATSFPASLYLNGFWSTQVARNDVRSIIRNMIVVACVSVLSLLLLTTALSARTLGDRFAGLFRAIGANPLADIFVVAAGGGFQADRGGVLTALLAGWFKEAYFVLLGILIVNTLFFGPMVQTILEFILDRNRARVYALQFREYMLKQQRHPQQQQQHQHLQHHDPSINVDSQQTQPARRVPLRSNLPEEKPPVAIKSQSVSPLDSFPKYQEDPIFTVALYELTHLTDLIAGTEMTSRSTTDYLISLVQPYWVDFCHSIGHYRASKNITSSAQVTQVIEYETVSAIRSVVFAPIVEEVVYRSALYPFLLHFLLQTYPDSTSSALSTTILASGAIFASCHLHHFFRHYAQHRSVLKAAIIVTVQWTYCFLYALFGGYIYSLPYLLRAQPGLVPPASGNLFLDARSFAAQPPIFCLLAAIVAHAICNAYGLPELDFVTDQRSQLRQYRWVLLACYFVGLVSFGFLMVWLPTLLASSG